MLRFEAKHAPGARTCFVSQQGDSKMVIRISGRDLIFVSQEFHTKGFGFSKQLEVVDFDGKVHLVTTTKKLISGFSIDGYAGLNNINVWIDGIKSVEMKVI